MAERTDSGRLFQRGSHELKALAPVLVLILGMDPLSDLSERDRREMAIKE